MPWEEKTVEKTRTEFVAEVLAKENSKSHLCLKYGITRRTGDKWLERARNGESMSDRSHCANRHPNQTSPEIETMILNERIEHPAWGARKLKRHLEDKGYKDLPAQSTICEILKRNSMIEPEESVTHIAYKRFEKEHPNEMWQMDFKGEFGLLNEQLCYPLTALDDCSRFSLCLEAKENQKGVGVFETFRKMLYTYGLPNSILCDNGPPWGDSSSGAITQFDVWMMQLGILPIHGRPKHPQTQGKEERFHRTLKEEVLKREVFADMASIQRRFDTWRYEYNYERPHSAIDLDTPSKRYRASKKTMPQRINEPEYDMGKNLRKVDCKGYIHIQSHRYYLTEALIGKMLELKTLTDKEIGLYYGAFRVAKINLEERWFTSKKIYLATEN